MKKTIYAVVTIISLAVIAVSALFYFRTTSATAQTQTIGYVDSDKLVEEFPPAKDANAAWDQYQQQRDDELKAKIIDKYKTDDLSSLPREAQLEIQKTIEDDDALRKQQFEKINKEKWEPARTKIEGAIQTVAQQQGVTIVLEKKVVLHGGADLTEKVLAALKQQ
jgi:outer membrane protein